MNDAEILTTLRKAGKPQTAAIYKRHGAGDDVYGVLTSEIAKLGKKIGVDHALGMELWKTGNAEARILAILVLDPQRITRMEAERLVDEGQVHFLACYLCDLLAKSPTAESTMRAWMKSPLEDRREIGYGILGSRLRDDADSIGDADAAKYLATIEREIHGSPNWARYAMNTALISIGTFKPTLREQALAVAKRIGTVAIDHGETTCKTPGAVASIEKASKRKHCP